MGSTANPKQRIKGLRAEAIKLGNQVVKVWVSLPHVNYLANEKRLIALAGEKGYSPSREYFTGVDYRWVRDQARDLTKQPIPETLVAVERDPISVQVENRLLTAGALLDQVARGNLFIVNHQGQNVSQGWSGFPSPDLIFEEVVGSNRPKALEA